MERIPVSGPWITQHEIDYVADAARTAWYQSANVYYQRFESAFCKYLQRRFCVSLPSCTSAIHLSLLAAGVGPGDEVIVPDATWIASCAPVHYIGATVVFADIERRGWCLDPQSVRENLTPRTKAIIAVNLYGNMCDYDALRQIADEHHLLLLEDAAESIGSEYKGKKAGSLGDTGVFSFHGSKTLTTGEGGLLATDDEKLFGRAMILRDHGRAPGDVMFFNQEIGFKYKMSAMQAAMGLAQLERVEELIGKKREIFRWYQEEFADVEAITLNWEAPETKSTYWMNTIVLNAERGLSKEDVMAKLSADGIDTRPFFHPLSSIPAFEKLPQSATAREKNRVAYEICPFGVNLPSALNLTREQVARVGTSVRAALA